MRVCDKRMLSVVVATVGGIAGTAVGGPTWQTVIKDGDTVGSSVYGTTGLSPTQIAVGTGGGVGILAFDSSTNDLFVRTSSAGASPTVVPTPTGLTGFDNLAITSNLQGGTRMAFVANSGSNVGVYEYDSNSPTVANPVYVQNSGAINGSPATGGTLAMQVNGTGQILLPALTGGQVGLLQASGNTPPSQTTAFLFNPTGSSYSLVSPSARFVQNGDGSGTALLTSGSTTGIYNIPTAGSPQPIYAPASGSTSAAPDLIIGSTHNVTSGVTLFETQQDTNNAHSELVLNKGGTNFQLAPTDGGAIQIDGEVTPTGKAAVYVPSSAGDTLGYINTTAQTSLTTAASTANASTPLGSIPLTARVSDPAHPSQHLVITDLQNALASPMVNDNGTVIFDALVAQQGSTVKNQALLEWQPGDASPVLLLEANVSTVQITPGVDSTVNSIFINAIGSESDFYKNALSNDGYLAINVQYTNPDSSTGQAVIETNLSAVPEPASLGLLSIAGLTLCARRRKR